MDLYPTVLAKFGLIDAIQNLVTVLSEASNLTIDFTADEISGLALQEELALYRIIQELANNTLKHAQATHMTVELKQQEENVLLLMEDNGRGFDPLAIKDSRTAGMGWKSIEARTAMLQAKMEVRSTKATGTQIEISIPLSTVI